MATSNTTKNAQTDINEGDEEEEDHCYSDYFQSIRTPTGLEIGIRVTWPQLEPFELSTRLPPDAMAPMFHGTQWAGTRIWRAAVVALQYLLCESCPCPTTSEKTNVIELGCGLGVPGMLLGLLWPNLRRVVLTDKDELVEQLEHNLEQLRCRRQKMSFSASTLQAASLDWSAEGVRGLVASMGLSKRGFDVVLNCDCVYEPLYGESWKLLVDCQEELLRLNPNAYVLTSVERRRADGVERYLDRLKRSNLVDSVEQVKVPFDYPKEVELYRIRGVQPRRRNVSQLGFLIH